MPGGEDRIPKKVLRDMFPRKLSQSRAADKICSELKGMILSGKLKKGRRIFREEGAQSFGVSENEVNKAVHRLKKDGLVVVKTAAGTYVV